MIVTVIGMHILLIALQIHKQSSFIKLSYKKQHLEHLRSNLGTLKNQRSQQYAALSNPTLIKKYAHEDLALSFMKLQQLQRLSDEKRI